MVRSASMSMRPLLAPGPFRVEHLREGSPYELSDGNPVFCLPTGRRGGRANLIGGEVLETDPAVKSAGVDVGFSRDASNLRAPDVSVGDFADEPGWAPAAPPLAVEYADTGQDEGELQKKIAELLDAGTKLVWVVRLVGPRRVEIHERRRPMRLAKPGEALTAPGILKNPVPVLALYDREAAHEATLRNLLQRRGYESLDAVRAEAAAKGQIEGKIEGKIEGEIEGEIKGCRDALFAVLESRGLAVSEDERARILAARDPGVLARWVARAATAGTSAEALATRKGSTTGQSPKPRLDAAASPRKPRRK
jgi:Uma2 family endonuclease